MSLADQIRNQFSSAVRERGTRYFRQRLVTNIAQAHGTTYANVSNGYGNGYEVMVDQAANGHVDEMDCTCPYFDGNGPCKHIWATILKIDATSGTRAAITPPTSPPPPSWSQRLDAVLRLEQQRDDRVTTGVVHRKKEVWYVIDVERSQQKKSLVIELQFREEGQSGAMGTIKECKLNEERISSFSDAEHRQILRELLDCLKANQPDDPYAAQRNHYSSYQPAGHSRVTLPTAAGSRLLPLMAATGQLRWSLSASTFGQQSDALDRRVAWAGTDPWTFEVQFQEKRKDQYWLIRGMLAAELDGSRIERLVRDAVLVSESGFVLFEESIGPLVPSSDSPWFEVLRQVGELKVPFKERESFVKKILSSKSLSTIDFPTRLVGKSAPTECRPRLRFLKPDALPGHLQNSPCVFGAVDFVYGDVEVRRLDDQAGVWDEKSSRVVWRNAEQESQYEKQLLDCGIDFVRADGWNRGEVEVQVLRRVMPETVRQLIDLDWEVRAAGIQIRKPGDFKIGVTSGQDWFDLDAEFDFDGVSVALPALLQAVRNGDHFVKLGDGSQGLLPEEWIQRYAKIAGLGEVVNDSIRFRPSQAMILDALLDAQQGATRDRDFASFCRKLKNFAGIKPKAAPRTFRGDLRDYQKDGLGWLNFLREFRLGGCLADDMGLGKTVQVLAMLDSRRTRKLKSEEVRKPSLIVVPKSLIFNWMAEAERFAPNLTIINYTGTARTEVFSDIADADAMITTYGTLRKDITQLTEMEFDYAVLDESQAIKNSGSLSSKACRLIKADHRLAMTGTPVENHLGELWSLFEFLNPGMLGSSNAFKALTRVRNADDEDDNGQQHLQTVAQALRPFMLRRTKEQVLTELPGKTEQTLYCDMPPKQKKLYNELRDYYRIQLDSKIKTDGLKKSKIHVLEALLRLRQAACHPGLIDKHRAKEASGKVDVAIEQLVQLAAEGHKALVFSQFTSLLSIVKTRLDKEKIPYEYLDGKTNKRQERVEAFQNNKDCPLFLISLKAGGHGLNLTAADYVFILDPWWNPAVEAQAVDRAHRMGQEQHVFAYRLICRDTVEERILEMQKEKRLLADAIVSADGSLIKSLTAEDLQLLLS